MQGVDWDEMELSPRTLESWQATFSTLRKAASASGEGVDPTMAVLVMATTKTEVDFTMTPARKKRAHQSTVEVETVTSDDEALEDDTPRTPKMKRVDMPWKDVPMDIGTTQPTPTIKVLQGGVWSNLVENVNVLKDDFTRESMDHRVLEEDMEEQFEKVQVKISVLRELLGVRPDHFGTRSAFQLLETCMATAATLEEAVRKQQDKKPPPAMLDQGLREKVNGLEQRLIGMMGRLHETVKGELEAFLSDTTSDFRTQFVDPTLALLTRSSSSNRDPGGKWADLLDQIQKRVDALERVATVSQQGKPQVHSTSGAGGAGLFSWSTTGNSSHAGGTSRSASNQVGVGVRFSDQQGVDELDDKIQRLMEKMSTMRAELKDLQDQADTEAITIGSIVFPSRSVCVTWLALHNATADPHVFVDAVSLLSLATSDASLDEEKAANQRATTAKVRDKTPYHTAYIASFNLEVPPLLGKGSDHSMTTNSRALGGVPKFEDFHPPSGREGIHQRILDHVKDGSLTLQQAIGELFTFGTEPSSVAREMLLLSKTFWDELCHWMVRYHAQVQAESEASEQEVWILISHCVRAVLKSLREARSPGRASNTPGGMLWGTLRAHEIMKQYCDADFSGHPKIALILHEHLIRFSTPRSKFESLQTQMNERFEKLQRAVNQAVTSANKSSKKG